MLSFFKRFFPGKQPETGPLVDTLASGRADSPSVLILSSAKKNQNYYRDCELAQQSRAVFLGEAFDFEPHGFQIEQVVAALFGGRKPDYIFLNYNHGYTHRLKGFDRLGVPVFAFVGDHYDFTDSRERAKVKQAFYQTLPLAALVTAYPHTNAIVAEAIGRPDLPFIHLPWAIDPSVFRDLGGKRRYDIACLGAHTDTKYPFRRQVRAYLEQQKELRFFKKQRVCGHDGVLFNKALNRMRSAFTCASVFQYTLMKYFEIPASGALLFAEETQDLAGLGFKDGENFVKVTPADFPEKFRYYLIGDGREQGEQIRRAGNAFVRSNHTWALRFQGLLKEFEKHGRK